MRDRARDKEKMESAAAEIEIIMESLEHIFQAFMWPVDPVLAAKVEVARNILEGVDNDIHDSYDVARWFE